ncbi:hypothetical protein Tco_0436608 [Tanacetum coccineum]
MNLQLADEFLKPIIGEGFHAIPPPYTKNYMRSRPDLSFAGLDDYVYKTKDTDSDNDSVFRPKSDQTKPKVTKINFVKYDEYVKSVNKENTHRQVEYPRKSQSLRDNKRNWNELMTQKLGNDKHVEVEKDGQEEVEMKSHIKIVKDNKVAIDAIPLATNPPVIVEYQIDKDGRMGYFKLIRADESSKRPEEDYEIVLWGDLKVMFEPDIKSKVWRNLQGYKVIVWKLFDNCGVHFVRFRNLHIFMLVEKRYPLTPITILYMLNKKLQADRWNEMYYQLLKLMTKQEKGP